ncbi:uncharacterized protein [Palaemon carinicauda]|uniref:uncharacterized protein n=1 Tax=Palaemon carinicauda TaxID=392227 RepID=UPI0035B61ED2
MDEFNPKSIPCDLSVNKCTFEESPELVDSTLYRNIVRSLIYIMTFTRPDLSFVVSKLSQYMARPTQSHLAMCKYDLKFLKGTKQHCLVLKRSYDTIEVSGYCDSDWGSSEDRKSITGYCYQMNAVSALISWKSKKQSNVA